MGRLGPLRSQDSRGLRVEKRRGRFPSSFVADIWSLGSQDRTISEYLWRFRLGLRTGQVVDTA